MPYNLIHEPWIPVRYENGETGWIEPWRVTDPDRPPIALAAPRPDFNGALIQFLIGLVQTCCPPATERDWRRWFKKPPPPEELKAAFTRYEHAFNLGGDGPRFMQDYDELDANPLSITDLLIDVPTGKTLDDNKDHFIKDHSGSQMAKPIAAMALLTLQVNAPSGGQGHRTSLRGGGPLTTVVLGRTLWQTLWLNVLTKADFEGLLGTPQELLKPESEAAFASSVFPWMRSTRSSAAAQTMTPDDAHPLTMYWAVPRRVQLQDPHQEEDGHLAGEEQNEAYRAYTTKNLGANYEGAWIHPLTPYRTNKDGTTSSIKGQPGHFSYRYWLSLTSGETESGVRPAQVVRAFPSRANYKAVRLALHESEETSLRRAWTWVFGYDMDNMKARRWHESRMPLLLIDPAVRADFEEFAGQLVATASELASGLRDALTDALYPKKGRRPRGTSTSSVIQDTVTRFWRDTEPAFYDLLAQAQRALEEDAEAFLQELRRRWLADLRKGHLLRLFDEITQYGAFRAADPRAVVKARQALRNMAKGGQA